VSLYARDLDRRFRAPIWRNHYEADNPLNIEPLRQRSDNYFLVLGDWGKSIQYVDGSRIKGRGECQWEVFQKINAYVKSQAARGKRLLFVANVGDSFYWSGVKPSTNESWRKQWAERYGVLDKNSALHGVPFLSVMGNHDYGNTDKWAACPHRRPRAVVGGQGYASTQFNSDKNPEKPEFARHYWLPDYNYHYSIPELDLELIAVDQNMNGMESNYPWGIGGSAKGHEESFHACGGWEEVRDFLFKVGKSGEELLVDRARHSAASTVVIINHYLTQGARLKLLFEAAQRELQPSQMPAKVLSAYGHVHGQACHGRNVEGECDVILSGGGGGCCKDDLKDPGFTAIHLRDNGGFVTNVDGIDVRIARGNCSW